MVTAEALIDLTRSTPYAPGFPYDPLDLTIERRGTCTPIDIRYATADRRFVRDAIEDLAANRFDFWIDAAWDADGHSIDHRLVMQAGARGVTIGNTIDLTAPGVTLGAWSRDSSGRVDDVFEQGNGFVGRATNPPPYRYPFFQKAESLSDVRAQDLLDHHAAYNLDRSANVLWAITVTITDPTVLKVGEFTTGDRVAVVGPIGNYETFTGELFRIEQAGVTLQPNGILALELTLSTSQASAPVLTLAQQERTRIDRLDAQLQKLAHAATVT
jgi:hypothetical protein